MLVPAPAAAASEVPNLPLLETDCILVVVAVMSALTASLPRTVSATFLEHTWGEEGHVIVKVIMLRSMPYRVI